MNRDKIEMYPLMQRYTTSRDYVNSHDCLIQIENKLIK